MTSKQYRQAALMGTVIALGDIVASHLNGQPLGAFHVLFDCLFSALMTAKVIDISLKARN